MARNRKLCVQIARDVLTQLRLKRFQAEEGTYVNVNIDGDVYNSDSEHHSILNKSFKEYFKKNKQVTCQVCAIGAAFVSMINIKNKCSVWNVMMEDDKWKRLGDCFGADNIDLMESAFEICVLQNANSSLSHKTLYAASLWGSQYQDPNKRLRAIMLNVIRNKGDFKIPSKFLKHNETSNY